MREITRSTHRLRRTINHLLVAGITIAGLAGPVHAADSPRPMDASPRVNIVEPLYFDPTSGSGPWDQTAQTLGLGDVVIMSTGTHAPEPPLNEQYQKVDKKLVERSISRAGYNSFVNADGTPRTREEIQADNEAWLTQKVTTTHGITNAVDAMFLDLTPTSSDQFTLTQSVLNDLGESIKKLHGQQDSPMSVILNWGSVPDIKMFGLQAPPGTTLKFIPLENYYPTVMHTLQEWKENPPPWLTPQIAAQLVILAHDAPSDALSRCTFDESLRALGIPSGYATDTTFAPTGNAYAGVDSQLSIQKESATTGVCLDKSKYLPLITKGPQSEQVDVATGSVFTRTKN